MKKWLTFWNDDDGFSAKDFLMILFCVLFALFLITAFVLSLVTGTLPAATIAVIGMMNVVVPTIVGGVFGVQVVKEIKKQPDTPQTEVYVSPVENVEQTTEEETPSLP